MFRSTALLQWNSYNGRRDSSSKGKFKRRQVLDAPWFPSERLAEIRRNLSSLNNHLWNYCKSNLLELHDQPKLQAIGSLSFVLSGKLVCIYNQLRTEECSLHSVIISASLYEAFGDRCVVKDTAPIMSRSSPTNTHIFMTCWQIVVSTANSVTVVTECTIIISALYRTVCSEAILFLSQHSCVVSQAFSFYPDSTSTYH